MSRITASEFQVMASNKKPSGTGAVKDVRDFLPPDESFQKPCDKESDEMQLEAAEMISVPAVPRVMSPTLGVKAPAKQERVTREHGEPSVAIVGTLVEELPQQHRHTPDLSFRHGPEPPPAAPLRQAGVYRMPTHQEPQAYGGHGHDPMRAQVFQRSDLADHPAPPRAGVDTREPTGGFVRVRTAHYIPVQADPNALIGREPTGGFPRVPSGGHPAQAAFRVREPSGHFVQNPTGAYPRSPSGGFPYPEGVPRRHATGVQQRPPTGAFFRVPTGAQAQAHFAHREPTGGFVRVPTGAHPRVPTGTHPRVPTGAHPRLPTETHPRVLTGSHPRPPTGAYPRVPTGTRPQIATGDFYRVGSGAFTRRHATGPHAQIPTGTHTRLPTGHHPRVSTGTYPHPNHLTRREPTGAFARISTGTHPRIPTGAHPRIPTGTYPRSQTGAFPHRDPSGAFAQRRAMGSDGRVSDGYQFPRERTTSTSPSPVQRKPKVNVTKHEIAHAQRVVQIFHRAYQAFSFYPFQHPVVRGLIQELFEAIQSFFQLRSILEMRLERFSISYFGHELMRDENQLNNFVFLLFSDGIRKLDFYEGLHETETLRFFEALHRCSQDRSRYEDAVTLLWEQHFDYIRYHLVEEMFEVHLPHIAELSHAYQEDEIAWDTLLAQEFGAHSRFHQQSGYEDRGNLAVHALAGLEFPMGEEQYQGIRELWGQEQERLVTKFFEVVGRVLSHHHEQDDKHALVELLQRLVPLLLEIEELGLLLQGLRVIQQLVSHFQNSVGVQEDIWRQSLQDALRQASQERVLLHLVQKLDLYPRHETLWEQIEGYVELFDARESVALCRAFLSFQKPVSRERWCQILVNKFKSQPKALAMALRCKEAEVVVVACRILGALKRREVVPFLEKAARHPMMGVKIAALDALARTGGLGNSRRLHTVLIEAFESDDKALRTAALQTLSHLQREGLALVQKVLEQHLHERWSPAELKTFFEGLASLGDRQPAALELLADALIRDHKGLSVMKRRNTDVPRIAISVLHEHASAASMRVIQRLHDQGSRQLRRFCEEVLSA